MIYDEDSNGFFKGMLHMTMASYLLSLGEFDTDFATSLAQVLFTFGTVFLMLTLLNLVIALMGDAYEEVMSGILEQDANDTNNLIIEMEKLFFWNRNVDIKTFFYVMDYSSENSSDWKSRT